MRGIGTPGKGEPSPVGVVSVPPRRRTAGDPVPSAVDGRLGGSVRRFGDLDVIVSVVPETGADGIRAYLPDGYPAELTAP